MYGNGGGAGVCPLQIHLLILVRDVVRCGLRAREDDERWPDLRRWCFLFPDMSSLIALIRAESRGLSLEGS